MRVTCQIHCQISDIYRKFEVCLHKIIRFKSDGEVRRFFLGGEEEGGGCNLGFW